MSIYASSTKFLVLDDPGSARIGGSPVNKIDSTKAIRIITVCMMHNTIHPCRTRSYILKMTKVSDSELRNRFYLG
jgi:hypothetical protein